MSEFKPMQSENAVPAEQDIAVTIKLLVKIGKTNMELSEGTAMLLRNALDDKLKHFKGGVKWQSS